MFWPDFADSFRRRRRSPPTFTCQTSPKAASTRVREKQSAYRGLTAIRALRLRAHVLSVHFSRWWARPSSTFLTTLPVRSFCSACCWDALYAAFCARLAGCRSCFTRFPAKSFRQKGSRRLRISNTLCCCLPWWCCPCLVVNDVGMGDPFFCKYICPQGVLEGAIPLAITNAGIRSALGQLFTWKLVVLVAVVVLSVLFYRPFCKWICPLGAFYGLMNKVSLLGIRVDACKCVSCGKCSKVCQMDVDVVRAPNHAECIRCGKVHRGLPRRCHQLSLWPGYVPAEKLPLTADKK